VSGLALDLWGLGVDNLDAVRVSNSPPCIFAFTHPPSRVSIKHVSLSISRDESEHVLGKGRKVYIKPSTLRLYPSLFLSFFISNHHNRQTDRTTRTNSSSSHHTNKTRESAKMPKGQSMSQSDASRIQSSQAKGGGDMSSSGFASRAQSAGDRNANEAAMQGGGHQGGGTQGGGNKN
jgi:hypothetical protein